MHNLHMPLDAARTPCCALHVLPRNSPEYGVHPSFRVTRILVPRFSGGLERFFRVRSHSEMAPLRVANIRGRPLDKPPRVQPDSINEHGKDEPAIFQGKDTNALRFDVPIVGTMAATGSETARPLEMSSLDSDPVPESGNEIDEPGKPDMRLFPLIPLDVIYSTGTHWLERARVELRVLVQVAATHAGNQGKEVPSVRQTTERTTHLATSTIIFVVPRYLACTNICKSSWMQWMQN